MIKIKFWKIYSTPVISLQKNHKCLLENVNWSWLSSGKLLQNLLKGKRNLVLELVISKLREKKHSRKNFSSFNIIRSCNFIKNKAIAKWKSNPLGHLVSLGSQLHHDSLCLHHHMTFSCVSLPSRGCLLIGTPAILDWGYILLGMTSSWLITFATILASNKVKLWDTWV